jgi:hypothetical protein
MFGKVFRTDAARVARRRRHDERVTTGFRYGEHVVAYVGDGGPQPPGGARANADSVCGRVLVR